MAANNDFRGWIMSGVSGVACVLGSAIICVDVILSKVTPQKRFRIANSNGFLSASLCLSAGVMLFTSLYSMLPTSKQYLTRAGLSNRVAAYTLIGLFLAGVIVIRFISALIHRHIPSHIVDCAHTHDQDADLENGDMEDCSASSEARPEHHEQTEQTPLLSRVEPRSFKSTPAVVQRANEDHSSKPQTRKESLRLRLTRRISLLMGGVKPLCDDNGPCYGFSQTCGRECTKTLVPKVPATIDEHPGQPLPLHQSISVRPSFDHALLSDEAPTPQTVRRLSDGFLTDPSRAFTDSAQRQSSYFEPVVSVQEGSPTPSSHSRCCNGLSGKVCDDESGSELSSSSSLHHKPVGSQQQQQQQQHHHHVPQNAFLSIGLQTSLAIALHKLPEGFITYATNHASPTLGMTVFLALFIHNISEGFAMALPLYLALNSRWKAMFWSSLLGGISQPAGAGIAALWIWGARRTGSGGGDDGTTGPSWGVYGGMFAATAGVMTSVALQLFSEGLGLTHNRNFSIGCAIAGMGLMGLSFALTA